MPMFFLSVLTHTPGAKMFSPLYLTSPVILTPGMRSFMRFSVFKKVDLPQPEGPMSAVMLFSGMSILMPCSTSVLP